MNHLAQCKDDTPATKIFTKVSRQLRMLRDHGLIKKMPRQNRYQLTPKGQQLTAVLNATLAASTQQLTKMAA
jgi:DNA-binding HxlR family transcriptional regulator